MRHVPNVLTMLRLAATPVVVWLLVQGSDGGALRWWACATFALAMATDFADGYIARKFDIISPFGKLMDPIADKMMVSATLITLSCLGEVWWWLTVVIVGREVLITIARLIVVSKGVVAAAWAGKVKTVTQSLGLLVMTSPLVLDSAAWRWSGLVLLLIAAVLTVYSGALIVRGMRRGTTSGAAR